MRRVAMMIALLGCATGAHASDRSADRWIDACSASPLCDDFKADWPKALRGDPDAQKNLTFYFSTGAGGAVKRDLEQACAWEIVLLAARHPKTPASEGANLRHYCGRAAVGSLERPMAIAAEIFVSVYGKALPPPPWEWAPSVADAHIPGEPEHVLSAIKTAARLSAQCRGGSIDQARVNQILSRYGVDARGGAPGGAYDATTIRAATLREMDRQGVKPSESNCRNLRSFYGPLGMTIPGIAIVPMAADYPN